MSSGNLTKATLNKHIIYTKKDGRSCLRLDFYLDYGLILHISPPDCDAWWAPQFICRRP